MRHSAELRDFSESGDLPVVSHVVAWNGLAPDAYRLWAFHRAEQVGFSSTPFRADNDIPILMAHVRSLSPKIYGLPRLQRFGQHLLGQLLQFLSRLPKGTHVVFALCLPERMGEAYGETHFRNDGKRLSAYLVGQIQQAGLRVLPVIVPRGHASLAHALQKVGPALQEGHIDLAIVGGLDSAYDPEVVQALLASKRLYDGERIDSHSPGEGGAFFCLSRAGFAKQHGWPIRARVHAASTSVEPAHLGNDLPCAAVGLTAAAGAITRRMTERLDWWLHDMTNEHYRIHEFQLAWPRCASRVMNEHGTMHSLHGACGDLGAAFMPTAVALAAQAFLRGGPSASNCMITGSSLFEDRGAVLVSAPTLSQSGDTATRKETAEGRHHGD